MYLSRKFLILPEPEISAGKLLIVLTSSIEEYHLAGKEICGINVQ
jgi:hypothetical protein